MNMKDMIQRMTDIEANKQQLNEAEMPPMGAPAPMNDGNPVTVNISMNASGKEHVADLLGMMKNAGLGDAEPVSTKMLSPRLDMERLAGIVDDPEIPGKDEVPGDSDTTDSSCNDDIDADVDEGQVKREMTDDAQQMDKVDFVDKYSDYGAAEASAMWDDMNEDVDVDEWANSPDGVEGEPEHKDHHYMTKDLSGGINRSKKQFKAAQPGDNAMAMEGIKEHLYNLLAEKKAKPDFLDVDKDGDKKEPMKKALKDKGGNKPKKGVKPSFKKGVNPFESIEEAQEKMPSKAHITKMCKDGKTTAEICKMHPDCDQAKLKAMIKDCNSVEETYEDKKKTVQSVAKKVK
jgi:hypothetical protein|tara:strand:- start:82 stop:1119 length:1038 start_codon:yes stop_codon:yes gene_type:complete